MQIVNLYKYEGTADGRAATVVSPALLPMPYTPMYRLIADEGKDLHNTITDERAKVIDVENTDNWTEVDEVIEPESEPESPEVIEE